MKDLKATGELTARVRFCWKAYLIFKIRVEFLEAWLALTSVNYTIEMYRSQYLLTNG